MPEIGTLFVRIDADLSDFKRGLREAGRETRAFANETNRAFADVGTALDLSPFRKELAQSERVAIQAAERMSKAFAEVGKSQERAAARSLEKLAQGAGRPIVVARQDGERSSDAPFGLSQSQEETRQRVMGGVSGAGLALGALSIGRIAAVLALPGGAVLFLGLTLAGVLLPEIIKAFSGGGGSIESLESQIAALQSQKRLIDPLTSDAAEQSKQAIQEQIDALTSLRDALLEQQRLTTDSTAQNQAILGALTGLPDSLNQFGGRIDNLVVELLRIAGDAAGQSQELLDAVSELGDSLGRLCECVGGGAPPPPPGVPDASRPDGIGFGGSQGGGQFLRASFTGGAPFGGGGPGGLDRELADTGWQVQDLSAGFVELTEAAGGFEAQGASLVAFLIRSNALLGEQSGLLGQLSAQAPVLGGELAALFEAGSEEGRVFAEVADAVGASLLDAFEGAIERGESLSDVLKGLALDFARLAAKRGAPAMPPTAPANAEVAALAMAA